jgi:hypothetical protein
MVEKVLAVEEGNGALYRGLSRHLLPP